MSAFIEFRYGHVYVKHIVNHSGYDKLIESYRKKGSVINIQNITHLATKLQNEIPFMDGIKHTARS